MNGTKYELGSVVNIKYYVNKAYDYDGTIYCIRHLNVPAFSFYSNYEYNTLYGFVQTSLIKACAEIFYVSLLNSFTKCGPVEYLNDIFGKKIFWVTEMEIGGLVRADVGKFITL